MTSTALWWVRLDLRLADNPALESALARGGPVVPVFVFAPDEEAPWAPGAASRWWLHRSLAALDAALRARGSRLVIRAGPSEAVLAGLCAETGARAVYWNRRYEPAVVARDTRIKQALRARGIDAISRNGALLFEPWTIADGTGAPFRVFSPFWRRCLASPAPPPPTRAPASLGAPADWPESVPLDALRLEPRIAWDAGLCASWMPGEAGAQSRLAAFLAGAVSDYRSERDDPARASTSRLSPHLHFGEVSPRQVWHAVRLARDVGARGEAGSGGKARSGARRVDAHGDKFLAELGWREFAYHLLYHFPLTPNEPLRPEFRRFPWRSDPVALRAWQRGRTGFPMVDAGLRELWATGWMHNRARMLAASLLVKNLNVPWQEGAAWFWDTLVDADLASNTLGWQWTAGCGADGARFFRVFNPMGQGSKFDAEGAYVRRWLPELARLPAEVIHAPWEAPPLVLAEAGVRLGVDYPRPIVDFAASRDAAQRAFEALASDGA